MIFCVHLLFTTENEFGSYVGSFNFSQSANKKENIVAERNVWNMFGKLQKRTSSSAIANLFSLDYTFQNAVALHYVWH